MSDMLNSNVCLNQTRLDTNKYGLAARHKIDFLVYSKNKLIMPLTSNGFIFLNLQVSF